MSSPVAPIDPNVYYYSFSTIAQTLAGAFGFLAAVVLFRLQSLNSQLETIASNLIGDLKTFITEPFRTLFAYQRWPLFVLAVKRDQDPANRTPCFKNLNFLDLGAMDHANNQILAIRRWFLISMIMTVVGITLCLIALVLTAWVLNPSVLIALLILGLLALATYIRLMLIVLQ